jgi:methylmalonyl-CoA carboxyltransferase large subunit
MSKVTLKSLNDELEALRAQMVALTSKMAELAAEDAGTQSGAPAPVAAAAEPEPEEISEEILMAISAAVAAYLGKRARIRTVRLLSSTAWAQQGRVNIQASHRLDLQHYQTRVR